MELQFGIPYNITVFWMEELISMRFGTKKHSGIKSICDVPDKCQIFSIPIRFILAVSVVGFSPKRSDAPPGP